MLTWGRIFAIPLIVLFFYLPYPWSDQAAGILFALAGVTDSLDGYLARKLGQISRLGAFLDPVADKLIVAVALVLLVSRGMQPTLGMTTATTEIVLVLAACVIIGRELAISALREWMAQIGAWRKVAVSGLGKFKTIVQITGLSLMLFRWDFLGLPVFSLGLLLTVAAAILTLWSGILYLRAAWPELTARGADQEVDPEMNRE
jgi:CDP-diacylglycerol--glycerol-3-phosphate 3-phosphatidyltransferase